MKDNPNNQTLYDAIGGKETLRKVHRIFYDKIYAHPWIGKFFGKVRQELIEEQQTDFMAEIMGGPKQYFGKLPMPAHKHMFITEEIFLLRKELLTSSLQEFGLSPELIEQWLKLDSAFKKGIVKNSAAECTPRYTTDEIEAYPNPNPLKRPA